MCEEAPMQWTCFHGWLFPIGSFMNFENSRNGEGFSVPINSETPPTQISHKNGVIYPYISSAMDYFGLLIFNSIRVLGP